MASEIDIQETELKSYQLYLLLIVASLSSDELEPSEVKSLFELAYQLSIPISCFMQTLESEALNDGK